MGERSISTNYDAVINTLAEFAPNIKDLILHKQVITPWGLEQQIGISEGNICHGELTLDQLFFMRLTPGWAKNTAHRFVITISVGLAHILAVA